ncbi:unnamed protein product, partial [Amoebophrya sp. A120]
MNSTFRHNLKEFLHLGGNTLHSLDGIPTFPVCGVLNLDNNCLTQLAGLRQRFPRLQRLDAKNNKISDLSELFRRSSAGGG